MNTDEPQTLKLSASGMANVAAKDIEAPSQVEVMNKKSISPPLLPKSQN